MGPGQGAHRFPPIDRVPSGSSGSLLAMDGVKTFRWGGGGQSCEGWAAGYGRARSQQGVHGVTMDPPQIVA